MEKWRKVWRNGLAPQLSTAGLQALRKALIEDDPRLIQGATTSPPPLQCVQDWPVDACCVLGFCGWQGDGHKTVAEVGEYFGKVCIKADQYIGEPATICWFLDWADEAPREEMRRELLAEVERALAPSIVGI